MMDHECEEGHLLAGPIHPNLDPDLRKRRGKIRITTQFFSQLVFGNSTKPGAWIRGITYDFNSDTWYVFFRDKSVPEIPEAGSTPNYTEELMGAKDG